MQRKMYSRSIICPNRTSTMLIQIGKNLFSGNYSPKLKILQETFAEENINQHNLWIKCESNPKLNAYIRDLTNSYSYVKSPWLLPSSIYLTGIDGLHCELNIPSIVAKYYILFAFDFYSTVETNDSEKMSEEEISNHIFKCVKLKCSFPSGNKAHGRVKLFGNNIRVLISDPIEQISAMFK